MTAFGEIVRGTSRQPHHVLIRALARVFDALNARVWWSHNDHFHGWVLRRLRAVKGPAVVVDVGCGAGTLVEALRSHGLDPVVGIDPDELMARTATERFAADDAVTIARKSFFDLARGDGLVPATGAAAITMIASLHHLAHERSLETSLAHARDLLASRTPAVAPEPRGFRGIGRGSAGRAQGGRLLVVGLARPSVPADFAVDAVSVVLNPLMGFVKSYRRRGHGAVPGTADHEDGMPVRDPDETFPAVVRAAATVLPGAKVRRRLWFRYTLEWTAPRAPSLDA